MTEDRRDDALDLADDATATRRWDREQMEIHDEGEPIDAVGPDEIVDEDAQEPDWNIGQMEIDDGGEVQRRIPPEPDEEGGPTGLGANPGGGERFGEIDDEPS